MESLFALERFLAHIQQNSGFIIRELMILKNNIHHIVYDYNNIQYVLDKYRKSKKLFYMYFKRQIITQTSHIDFSYA